MKQIKHKLRVVYGYFGLPALFLHELCHVISGLLVGYHFKYRESYFLWDNDGNLGFFLVEKDHRKVFWKSLINSLAPMYFVFGVAVLSVIYPVASYFLVYLLLAWRFSLPSPEDWRKVRYHRLYEKHLSNVDLMNRFFTLKGVYGEED